MAFLQNSDQHFFVPHASQFFLMRLKEMQENFISGLSQFSARSRGLAIRFEKKMDFWLNLTKKYCVHKYYSEYQWEIFDITEYEYLPGLLYCG